MSSWPINGFCRISGVLVTGKWWGLLSTALDYWLPLTVFGEGRRKRKTTIRAVSWLIGLRLLVGFCAMGCELAEGMHRRLVISWQLIL